jgi:flagellar export protein FliJ
LEEICQIELAELEMGYRREQNTLHLLLDVEERGLVDLARQHGEERLNLGIIGACFHDLQSLQRRIDGQIVTLQNMAESIRRKRDELIEVSKEKKALEKLKEKHEREIADSLNRAENRVMQDIATSQFHRQVVAQRQSAL